jgi:ferredoxin
MDPGEPRRILEFTADTSRLLGRWGAISTVFVIKTWRYGRLVARRGAGAATERADDARAAHPGDACDLCERKYLLGNSDYGGPACAGACPIQRFRIAPSSDRIPPGFGLPCVARTLGRAWQASALGAMLVAFGRTVGRSHAEATPVPYIDEAPCRSLMVAVD